MASLIRQIDVRTDDDALIGDMQLTASEPSEHVEPAPAARQIGLALSGGGYRAAAFHAGVLKRLAADTLLERVSTISTVSGGSLMTAALFAAADQHWPSSTLFRTGIFSRLRDLLTSTDLFSLTALGVGGVLRFNVRLLTSRADVLASRLASEWRVTAALDELPETPVWWINSTCVETGKNWRFAKRHMGDWTFGTSYAPPFGVAQAVAASAAVPYAIGALRLKLPTSGWYRTDPATKEPVEPTPPPRTRIRLWDGGAYENLGLEPVYKPTGLVGCDLLLCSDASGPLAQYDWSGPFGLLWGRLWSPRLLDVASDQIRSLRSRYLVQDIKAGRIEGALVRLGNSARLIDIKASRVRRPSDYDHYLTDEDAALAASEPTALTRLSIESFERLARSGWEIADATLATYLPTLAPTRRRWESE